MRVIKNIVTKTKKKPTPTPTPLFELGQGWIHTDNPPCPITGN